MTDFAEKIADAVEVALGDDGHCIVYKRQAVVAAIEQAARPTSTEAGEAAARIGYSDDLGIEVEWLTDKPHWGEVYAAPTDAQSRIAELEAQLARQKERADFYLRQLGELSDQDARIAALEAQLTESREREGRMREALTESVALNVNWVATAEPEHLIHLSEYKQVIAMGEAALAAEKE